MNRIDRLFATVLYLTDRGKATAEDLAEFFGVSRRTVLRDVSAITQSGLVDLQSGAGPGGGYLLHESPRHRRLSQEETVAVYIASEAYRDHREDPVARALRTACVKLEGQQLAHIVERVRRITRGLHVAPEGRAAPAVTNRLFRDVLGALGVRREVRFGYRAADGERSTRTVAPYGLLLDGRRWYLVGHDHLRKAVRMFRLDRMRALVRTGTAVVAPADFDMEAVRRRYVRDMVEANPEHFTVRFAVPRARRPAVDASWIGRLCDFRPLRPPLRMRLNGTRVFLDIEASYPETDTDYAVRFLWRLGPEITVLGPPRVQRAYRDLLRSAARFTQHSQER